LTQIGSLVAFLAVVVFTVGAHAEEARDPASQRPVYEEVSRQSENVSEKLSVGGWQFSGLVDFYYSYNFARPTSVDPLNDTTPGNATLRPGGNRYHMYENYDNQFSLALLEVTAKRTLGEYTFYADFDFGQVADQNAMIAPANRDKLSTVDESSKHIGQAIVSWSPKSMPGLVIDLGKMGTAIGIETVKAKENWNYSRSVLFAYGIPIWHVGVHAGYAVIPEKLTANVYAFNGWNNIDSINTGKTLGAQLRYSPAKGTTVFYNVLSGPEQPKSGALRTLHEIAGTIQLSQTFSTAIDLLSAEEDAAIANGTRRAAWKGATAAFKWQFSEAWYVSPRFEYFNDEDGLLLNDGLGRQEVQSYTLTMGGDLGAGMEVRFEARTDVGRGESDGSATAAAPDFSQTLVSTALLYSF
jgi:Putative beta-barrel porin-2, OmpL-like. bbp2